MNYGNFKLATLSPFRFPGGKGKLLPILINHIKPTDKFIDVFVGGGSVLLEVAKNPKIKLYANDKDYWIYCFWNTIIDIDKLNQLLTLMKQKITLKLFYKLRDTKTKDKIECAYRAIFFNSRF